jgi:hypothetical protein
MHIQGIYLWSALAAATLVFGLVAVGRFGGISRKRRGGKRGKALSRARELVGEMRRAAHSKNPERWKQVGLLGRLIVCQAEAGKFPLHEAGTSLQEMQKLKLIVVDKVKKMDKTAPSDSDELGAAAVPIGETAIELEPSPDGPELELDLAWRTEVVPSPLIVRLNPTSVRPRMYQYPESLPHEWRESHEESLLANFDTLFDKSFRI